jgi:hypothetical protein
MGIMYTSIDQAMNDFLGLSSYSTLGRPLGYCYLLSWSSG